MGLAKEKGVYVDSGQERIEKLSPGLTFFFSFLYISFRFRSAASRKSSLCHKFSPQFPVAPLCVCVCVCAHAMM